jgi:hypothetical protein
MGQARDGGTKGRLGHVGQMGHVGQVSRARRAQPEAAIQRAVFQHLRTHAAPRVFAFHPANGGYRKPVEAAILKYRPTVRRDQSKADR